MSYGVFSDEGAWFCGIDFQHKPIMKIINNPEYRDLPPHIKAVVFSDLELAKDVARQYGLYVYQLSFAGVPV